MKIYSIIALIIIVQLMLLAIQLITSVEWLCIPVALLTVVVLALNERI